MQTLSPRLLSLKVLSVTSFSSRRLKRPVSMSYCCEAEEVDAVAGVDEEIKAETEFKATRQGCRVRVCCLQR